MPKELAFNGLGFWCCPLVLRDLKHKREFYLSLEVPLGQDFNVFLHHLVHEGYLVVDDAENWPLWWPLLAGRDPELPLDFTAQDYEETGTGY